MRPTMRRPNLSSNGPLPGMHVPQQRVPAVVPPPPPVMTVMMMATPSARDDDDDAGSEPSIEEVDIDAKRLKEDPIEGIDTNDEDDLESMRF